MRVLSLYPSQPHVGAPTALPAPGAPASTCAWCFWRALPGPAEAAATAAVQQPEAAASALAAATVQAGAAGGDQAAAVAQAQAQAFSVAQESGSTQASKHGRTRLGGRLRVLGAAAAGGWCAV